MSATVHVWTIGLDTDSATTCSMLELLSGEERVRSARLRTTQERLRFITGRGALRSILSRYLGLPPSEIRIDRMPSGKPHVRGAALSFNLAHSGGLAVCAVTAAGRLGVDLERIRRVEDADAIVRKYFSPGELKQYDGFSPAARTAAFFSGWTRKEAFVKAVGEGLGRDLASFEVELSPGAPCPWLALDGPDANATWSLRSFAPNPQYLGAVALDREIEALEFFEWTPAASLEHRSIAVN